MGSDTNMPAVFSISTRITVLFTGWTTSTTTQYILTLVFLFLLAIFNRFLGAFKFQLEQSWAHNDSTPALNLAPGHRKIPKAKLSPLPTYMRVNKDEDEDPEEPSSLMDDTDKSTPNLLVTRSRKCVSVRHLFSWKANGYWSLQKDGTRSLIETVRALIGYLLMLAVMTFNVGVFLTVLCGVMVGELFLGRFSQGTSGWQEGTCHG